MALTFSNSPFMFGIVPLKPIITDLPGKIRVRMRNEDWVRAFIRHNGVTRHFLVSVQGDHWTLDPEFEQGRNATVTRRLPAATVCPPAGVRATGGPAGDTPEEMLSNMRLGLKSRQEYIDEAEGRRIISNLARSRGQAFIDRQVDTRNKFRGDICPGCLGVGSMVRLGRRSIDFTNNCHACGGRGFVPTATDDAEDMQLATLASGGRA